MFRLVRSLTLISPLLLCAAAFTQNAPRASVDESSVRLTFNAQGLLLDLPVMAAAVGIEATVSAKVLDFSGTTLSEASQPCSLSVGSTLCHIALPQLALPAKFDEDNLPLLRLRYQVTSSTLSVASGTLSLDQIAPQLFELHVFAPARIHAGGRYTARVLALHPLTGKPQAHIPLTADISAKYWDSKDGDEDDDDNSGTALKQVHTVTDSNGFATISILAPKPPTLASLELKVQGVIGSVALSTSQTMEVRGRQRMELVMDKPLYQPGQTVHTRVWVLDRGQRARAGAPVTLDFSDPNEILMFRAKTVTSKFGIATADWQIPSRVRLGDYSVHARTEGDNDTAYNKIHISRYDLPTFKVAPKADRSFYLPGQNAAVTVRADYLFGKPVLHGHVRVVREDDRIWNFVKQRYDIKTGETVEGELGPQGDFVAHFNLADDVRKNAEDRSPDAFSDLHLAAYVTDSSTGRTEQRRFDLRVTANALHIYAVQERDIVAGLPQRLYLAVTRADGTPAECDLDLAVLANEPTWDRTNLPQLIAAGKPLQHIHTNMLGLAKVELRSFEELKRLAGSGIIRANEEGPALYLTAHNTAGETGVVTKPLDNPNSIIRARMDKSLYKPGELIDVTVDTAGIGLPASVELFRITDHGPLLLNSREMTLTKGKTVVSFPSDDRFRGVIVASISALRSVPGDIETNSYSREDSSPLATAVCAGLFPHDDDLKVDVQLSRSSYKPGEQAVAHLAVHGPQDTDGDITDSASSALGVAVVDEAVEERNRTDSGQEPSPFFFYPFLEGSGEAGGQTLSSLLHLDTDKRLPPGVELAAEMVMELQANSLASMQEGVSNAHSNNYGQLFSTSLNQQLNPIRSALTNYLRTELEAPTALPALSALLAQQQIDLLALRDPWGEPYTVKASPTNNGETTLSLRSRGPDRKPDTDDDFDIAITSWRWFGRGQVALQRAVVDYHQRTGSYIRDAAVLREELQRNNIDADHWLDPWGHSLHFSFDVDRDDFTVTALTDGDGTYMRNDSGLSEIALAKIKYFDRQRAAIQSALDVYTRTHSFPISEDEFQSALRNAGISPDDLLDPWKHPLYSSFSRHFASTDQARTEVHIGVDGVPHRRTTVTPVTQQTDFIALRSLSEDGVVSLDDFQLASYSHPVAMQSATDATINPSTSGIVQAQNLGSVTGTIIDPSGAVIPNVNVKATSFDSTRTYVTQTGEDGQFTFSSLPIGKYTITIEVSGFTPVIYDGIDIAAQSVAELNTTLHVGSANSEINVTASAVAIQTDSSMLATVSGKRGVQNMPLFGRSLAGSVNNTAATPRLREYFPETLLWRPEVITAKDGTATLRFPVADNMTTWKLSAAASTIQGNAGAGAAEFRTFQPFFAAFDPPSILTVGDSVALPVTLRNYLDHSISVRGELSPAPWFRVAGAAAVTTKVAAQDSASPIFQFTALAPIADAKQQFMARAAETGDRIARPVTVHPDGREASVTAAGIATAGSTTFALTLPPDALPDGGETTLRVYPNLAAHMQEALTGMAVYPDGCAEQIISLAWPSLLLQRYATALPHPDPKLQQLTQRRLEEAYQNLIANQLPDGGFSYWRDGSRADEALTAYAVQFLHQAENYIAIDEDVLKHAMSYLAKAQKKDGTWPRRKWDGGELDDPNGAAMLTTSIAAMISGAPEADPLVTRALAATQSFVEGFDEPYTIAGYALAALRANDTSRSELALKRLRSLALTENDGAYWNLETNTPFFGAGHAGRVESTALALRALLAGGASPQDDLIARGLLFLQQEQDRDSLWYSTQATARVLDVMAEITLRGVTRAIPNETGSTAVSSMTVKIDGRSAASIPLPAATQDAGPILVSLPGQLLAGTHQIALGLPAGSSSATAQLVTNFYRPWSTSAGGDAVVNHERLQIGVHYNTTSAAPGTPVDASTHIERIGFKGYGMLMAEVGLPPGADVDHASLDSAIAASNGLLSHYDVLPDKVMFYLWSQAGGTDIRFRFTLRYAVNALSAASSVYDYYNPDARADLAPIRFNNLK